MDTGSPHLPSWSSDPIWTCRRPAWESTGYEGMVAFWPCYRGCAGCAQGGTHSPWLASICLRMGYRALNKNEGHKEGSFTPCFQLSAGQGWTPSLMYFLHISYVYRWWGLFPELSLWGLVMQIAGFHFSMFYLLPYDCRVRITHHLRLGFFGKYWEMFPLLNLLQNISQKAACQEEPGALHSPWAERVPACLLPEGICTPHRGRPAGPLSFSLATLPKLKKASLSTCSFKCRQDNAVAI